MKKIASRAPLYICIFSALTWGANAGAKVVDRIEASVNSDTILLSDVTEFRRTMPLREQLDPLFRNTPIATKGSKASDEEIVQYLIEERIITQEFEVKDSEVDQEVKKIQTSNQITRNTLIGALREQGFSFEDYFKLIRISVAKRNLIDRDIRTKVQISDDDVKNRFLNEQGRGKIQSYRIELFTATPTQKQFADQAKTITTRARRSIQGGKGAEEVADLLRSPQVNTIGVDLGYLEEDAISKAIREQAKQLKVGQLSPVFGSAQSGYQVIRLMDIKANQDQKLQEIKERVRNEIAAKEYQYQLKLWIDRKKQEAFIRRAGDPSVPKQYVKK